MAHLPGGPVGIAFWLALNLKSANAFSRIENPPKKLKPWAKRVVRVLADGPRNEAKPIARLAALRALPSATDGPHQAVDNLIGWL